MDIKCTYVLAGAGILTGATHHILKHCQENPALLTAFSIALPAGVKLLEMSKDSVSFTVQAESLPALKELWERYENGSLRNSLEDLLVTDDIKKMTEEEDVELKVNIDQDSYRNACLDLLIVENEGGLFFRSLYYLSFFFLIASLLFYFVSRLIESFIKS